MLLSEVDISWAKITAKQPAACRVYCNMPLRRLSIGLCVCANRHLLPNKPKESGSSLARGALESDTL